MLAVGLQRLWNARRAKRFQEAVARIAPHTKNLKDSTWPASG